uniref:C-type lectin domain-containing protein n=1 Tax=Acrobeloides nanus TaxID=290746 RepID=A0A914BX82_9BILA
MYHPVVHGPNDDPEPPPSADPSIEFEEPPQTPTYNPKRLNSLSTGKVTSWMKGHKRTAIIVPVVLVLMIVLLVGIFSHVLDGSEGSPTTPSPVEVTEAPTECDKNWEHFKKSCYKMGYNSSWYNAETNCTSYKAHLSSILDDAEKQFVLDMKFNDLSYPDDDSSRIWVGGMAIFLGNIRRITWSDESKFTDSNNPKKFHNDTCSSDLCCLKLRTNKKNDLWYLGNCTGEILPYVCKKPANKKT